MRGLKGAPLRSDNLISTAITGKRYKIEYMLVLLCKMDYVIILFTNRVTLGFWSVSKLVTMSDLNQETSFLYAGTFHLGSLHYARQHLSYGYCLEVKREHYQNSSVLDCVTECSQSAAH